LRCVFSRLFARCGVIEIAMAGKVRAAFLELSPKQDGLVLWSVFGGRLREPKKITVRE